METEQIETRYITRRGVIVQPDGTWSPPTQHIGMCSTHRYFEGPDGETLAVPKEELVTCWKRI